MSPVPPTEWRSIFVLAWLSVVQKMLNTGFLLQRSCLRLIETWGRISLVSLSLVTRNQALVNTMSNLKVITETLR